MAAEFRASMQDLSTQQPTADDVDELIGGYEALMHQPLQIH
jgi:hypothetical protein